MLDSCAQERRTAARPAACTSNAILSSRRSMKDVLRRDRGARATSASNVPGSSAPARGVSRTNTPTPCRASTTPSERSADTASRITVLLTPNCCDSSLSEPSFMPAESWLSLICVFSACMVRPVKVSKNHPSCEALAVCACLDGKQDSTTYRSDAISLMHLLFDRVRTLDFYVRRDHFDTRKKESEKCVKWCDPHVV